MRGKLEGRNEGLAEARPFNVRTLLFDGIWDTVIVK